MIVCWELKKCKDREAATRGKRYKNLGAAWYKMYQLTLKGYEGVHCDFEENEAWTVNGVNFEDYHCYVSLQNLDDKWYFAGDSSPSVDITKHIEYYDKYRIKKETA